MIMSSITANGAPAGGSSRRWIIASAAVVLLVGIGLALGAFKMLSGSPQQSNVASLNDVGRYVFVPSRGVAEVTVIDSKTDRVATRIALAGIPNRVLVSEAVGAMAASFAGQSKLEVIALSEPGNHAEVDLTITPEFMALSPDGYLVAAADSIRGAVSVMSLQNRKLLFRLEGVGDPRNLTFSQDGSQLYITDRKALELVVVDIVQQSVLERVALVRDAAPGTNRGRDGGDRESAASALARTPDGRYGFISFSDLNALVVVNLGTLTPVKWLRVGRAPLRPYGTADGRLMLVPNDGDQSVSVIDTTTLAVAATLPGAADVAAINTGWFESFAFVMSRSQKRVVVLDLMKFRKVGDIELPGSAGAGVVNSTGQKLYASLVDANRVAVIDTQTQKVLTLIDGVGRQPWGTTMARSNNYCH